MGKEMRDMIKKENKLCFQHRMERKTEIFSVVGGQAAAAGGNDTRTEAGRALRRGEAGDAAWYDIHLPPQPQCCLHKPLDDGTVADSLGTKITCERGTAARLFFV